MTSGTESASVTLPPVPEEFAPPPTETVIAVETVVLPESVAMEMEEGTADGS